MSFNGVIGHKLMLAAMELADEIAELQHRRASLMKAWEKWDFDTLRDMGYLTAEEYTSLKQEMCLHENVDGTPEVCLDCGKDVSAYI